MNNIQIYSNKGFNRGAELRENVTESSKVSMIPIFNEKFFFHGQEKESAVRMEIPSGLASLSEKKYFLGLIDDQEVWCVDLSELPFSQVEQYIPNAKLHCVRDFFHLIADIDATILAYAKGIVNWHTTHQFCNNCGTGTKSEEKGHRRKCENKQCATLHFPRISPAVIVLIEHKPEGETPMCLLNMRKNDTGYVGTLFAGFSEIGESLEDTIAREMKEEIAVTVNHITYVASQPWAFPSSLMLGFRAETNSKSFCIDEKEIKKAQWFTASEIKDQVHANELVISKKDSISHYLIAAWMEENS